jgi:hypothetical protein
MVRVCLLTLLVVLTAVPAWAVPAQNGLTGFLEMRSPEIEEKQIAYSTLNFGSVDNKTNRFVLGLGYQQNWTDRAEWGVLLPIGVTEPGVGLFQTSLLGKYQWVNSEYFLLATTGYILLPGSIGVTDKGSGQLGAGAELELAVQQNDVQLALSMAAERGDYCLGCSRLGFTNEGKAVLGVDSAVGLRVPIEQHKIVAEVHHNWSGKDSRPKIDDSGAYALVGGQFKVTEEWAGSVFGGAGFTLGGRENYKFLGGLTVAYSF